MKKRTAALLFLALVGALVLATLAVLRTRWAGDRLCGLAASRVEAATGLALAFGACRIDPLTLAVDAEGVRLGPPGAPVFAADAVRARLAPVQALGRQLHLAELRLVRPRVAAALPRDSGAAAACPPPLLERFEVRNLEVEDGALDLALPGGERLVVGRIDVRSRPVARSLRALAAPTRRTRVEVAAAPVRIDAAGRSLAAARVAAEVELALDLSVLEVASATVELDGAALRASGSIRDLCRPRLDLVVAADGPVRRLLALGGVESSATGTAAVEVRVTGSPGAPDLAASVRTRGVRVGRFVPGDAQAQVRLAGTTLTVERVSVTVPGGTAVAHGTVQLARGLPLAAEVELAGVDLAEVLERLGIDGPWVTLTLDGKGRVSGTLSPPQLQGTLSADLRDFKALTRSFHEGAADPGVIAFAKGRVETAVRLDREALLFDRARVTVGRGSVELDATVGLSLARGFSVRGRGDVDLGALGRLATIPWAGRAAIETTVGAAPYGNPLITGRVRAEGFRFLDIDLGAVTSDFRYEDFLLHLTGVEGARSATRYRGEAVVDLRRYPSRVVSSRFDATGRLRDLFDAVMDWLPRTRYVRDVMDGDVEVSGSATGPADALDATFDARLGTGTIWGRRYESGRGAGTIRAGREVKFERAEVRRGNGALRLAGTWGFELPFPWDLEVSFAGVPLADLDLPAGGLSGSASGTAALAGSYEHPRVRFAANGDEVAVHGVPLGTVQAGGTLVERRLVVTGGAEGIDFAAEARLEGRTPFQARATLSIDDAARLFPGGPPPGLRARVAGQATAAGDLADPAAARADVRLSTLQAGYGDLLAQAAAPVVLTVERGKVELAPVTLRGTNTELTVGGARGADGQLDVSASGSADLRLLAGLAPALRRPQGQLLLEAHVGGTAAEPVLVGAGRLVDGGFQLKGSQTLISSVGGELAFSQNRILFDALTASVNGGRANLRGEVELARLAPARLRIEADLDEVPLAVPVWLPATLSGRVEATGTPEETTLTGRLHVVRARYTADVDLEGSILELKRRPLPPPRPYDKAGEWLRFDLQLAVDGDARVDNDLVRGKLGGELTLTGSLAAPGLVGSLAMAEGSRVVFRGNEFILTHAVLEFTDRHKIELALDVHGESQVRDYQVLMHAFGSIARPDVTLTSVPPLPQPDIITLLSLGFTRRDAAAGAGVGGVATAAAAQAIFSASGLDDQVKRFLPRGGPIRDFSMRITSAYSEYSGVVEPRAEFESRLLRDRLRLLFQAPLGAARGRKAQAELRLGEHTAVQYQWDNDNPDYATGDHGVDLKLRWEWTDDR